MIESIAERGRGTVSKPVVPIVNQMRDVLDGLRSRAERYNDSRDVLWLQMLFQFYDQIYLAANDAEAAKAASKCLEITKKWNQIDNQSDLAAQSLGTAYTDVGVSARLLKKLDEAREAILAGLEIRKRLVERDPSNTVYRTDLAISWSQLNAVFWNEANYSGALDAEENALNLRKELVSINPTNMDWQGNLADSYADVAAALEKLTHLSEAHDALEMALKTRQLMVQAQPNRTDFADRVGSTMRRLAKLDQTIDSSAPRTKQVEAVSSNTAGTATEERPP